MSSKKISLALCAACVLSAAKGSVGAAETVDNVRVANRAHALIECSVFAEYAAPADLAAYRKAGLDLLVLFHGSEPTDPSLPVPAGYTADQRQAFNAGRMYDWWVKGIEGDLDRRQDLQVSMIVATDSAEHSAWRAERSKVAAQMFNEKNCGLLLPG